MTVIPVFERQRQEDCEFEASLDYVARSVSSKRNSFTENTIIKRYLWIGEVAQWQSM
jgi:hypothetical protein